MLSSLFSPFRYFLLKAFLPAGPVVQGIIQDDGGRVVVGGSVPYSSFYFFSLSMGLGKESDDRSIKHGFAVYCSVLTKEDRDPVMRRLKCPEKKLRLGSQP